MLNESLEEVLERAIDKHATRDDEFVRHFGKWSRPPNFPRYKLDKMKHLIRWSHDGEFIEMAAFVKMFRDAADRALVGEIARFVFEEFDGKPATDKTLNMFRIHLFRRLDAVGF